MESSKGIFRGSGVVESVFQNWEKMMNFDK